MKSPTLADASAVAIRRTSAAWLAFLLLLMWLPLRVYAQTTTISITPASVPDSLLGASYSVQLTAQGGTAPYRFRVIQGPMPPGLTLSADGLISGTTYQTGTFPFVVEATSSTQQVGAQAYTLQVTAPAGLNLSPSSMPQGMAGIRYLQPVTALGGVAPYTLSLSGPLPTGLSFNPASGIDGIPLEAGTFNFSVTAVDAASTTFTRNYSMVIVPPRLFVYTPVLPEATVATPYSTTILFSGGLGPFQYAVSGGSLPAGMSLGATDGVLSGTPVAAGLYTFDVTITDSTIGIPARVTQRFLFVVNDPGTQVEPATLPPMYLRVPFSAQLSLNVAGPGPATFTLISGELPQGLTLSSSGLLSGTPAYITFGPIEFTVQGLYPNGVFARRTYRVNVPAVAMTLSQLPPAKLGVPYSQTVQLVGGIPPYTVEFKVRGGRLGMEMVPGLGLPAGLTVSPAVNGNVALSTMGTFTISGTPTASGDFPLYIELLEESTRHREYAYLLLRVQPSEPTIIPPVLPDAAVGATYSHTMTAYGGVAPFRFELAQNQQLPPGLSLSTTGTISGTPTVSQTYRFDVVVFDSTTGTPRNGTTTVTLNVMPPPIVVSTRTVNVVAGTSATVELTDGASGGPFTAATIVSISPAGAGTASIVPSGSGANARYALTFVPAPGFSGVATVTYTLSNGSVTSAPATIAFTVVPRPDPTQDPQVRGLLDAQSQSAHRFATAQIGNFRARLERLHGTGAGSDGFSDSLTFATTGQSCTPRVGARPGETCVRPAMAAVAESGRRHRDVLFGTWVAGMLRSGDRDPRGGRPGLDFETEGVSAGGDRRFGDAYAGLGFGYGRDRTRVGDGDSRSDAKAYTVAAYGGYAPGEVYFLDAVVGYQALRFDLRRDLTAVAGRVGGHRDGRQWFAAVTAGADVERGRWQLSPYGRLEYARATLDGYREQGDPIYALRYDGQSLRSATMNLGMRFDYRVKTDWGQWLPQFRVEYQHDFQQDGSVTLHYADWTLGPAYRTDANGFGRNRLEIGLDAVFLHGADWRYRIGYRGLFDGSGRDHGLTFDIEYAF